MTSDSDIGNVFLGLALVCFVLSCIAPIAYTVSVAPSLKEAPVEILIAFSLGVIFWFGAPFSLFLVLALCGIIQHGIDLKKRVEWLMREHAKENKG